jgi:hypothetical protein
MLAMGVDQRRNTTNPILQSPGIRCGVVLLCKSGMMGGLGGKGTCMVWSFRTCFFVDDFRPWCLWRYVERGVGCLISCVRCLSFVLSSWLLCLPLVVLSRHHVLSSIGLCNNTQNIFDGRISLARSESCTLQWIQHRTLFEAETVGNL